jgi:predicted transcriptional regulator
VPSRQEWEAYADQPLPELPPVGARETLRKQMGITIEQAGRKCGVSRLTFRRWELGIWDPRPSHHRQYAALLDSWAQAIRTLG